MATVTETTDRALSRTEAARLLGVSARTWDRLRARPDFPAGRRLGPGTARWLESELLTWVRTQPTDGEAGRGRGCGRSTAA